MAGMAQIDCAVMISRGFELIGFGGELDRVDEIAQAFDPEGESVRLEETDMGTQHHSTYRLYNVLHDVLAMIVSQDGAVQVTKRKRRFVTV